MKLIEHFGHISGKRPSFFKADSLSALKAIVAQTNFGDLFIAYPGLPKKALAQKIFESGNIELLRCLVDHLSTFPPAKEIEITRPEVFPFPFQLNVWPEEDALEALQHWYAIFQTGTTLYQATIIKDAFTENNIPVIEWLLTQNLWEKIPNDDYLKFYKDIAWTRYKNKDAQIRFLEQAQLDKPGIPDLRSQYNLASYFLGITRLGVVPPNASCDKYLHKLVFKSSHDAMKLHIMLGSWKDWVGMPQTEMEVAIRTLLRAYDPTEPVFEETAFTIR